LREKQAWVMEYVQRHGHVDVLNVHFVDAYIERFTPRKVIYQPYGAHKVPEIGRLLSNMFRANMLDRFPMGLQYLCGMGFPRWVYCYNLPREQRRDRQA